jgi:hypothetical protein
MTGSHTPAVQIPLHFAHEYEWPAELDPPNVSYRRQPCTLSQRRFKGRDELIPQIDLKHYNAHAVLDWVQLKFSLTRKRQALNIARSVNEALRAHGGRENAYVTGPGGLAPYTGHEFYLRLQDPTPARLALTLSEVAPEI